jgi:hypothetical protein
LVSIGVVHDNVPAFAVKYSQAAHVGMSVVFNFASIALFKSVASNTSQFVKLAAAITTHVTNAHVSKIEKVSFPTFSKNLFLFITSYY